MREVYPLARFAPQRVDTGSPGYASRQVTPRERGEAMPTWAWILLIVLVLLLLTGGVGYRRR